MALSSLSATNDFVFNLADACETEGSDFSQLAPPIPLLVLETEERLISVLGQLGVGPLCAPLACSGFLGHFGGCD